ncbi:hypothetical protein IPG41_01205 [Candidatus Peregrinibacteria bacterium]|nr:MAG: hypothetical protein IPG41_01205 [Candidatus Peregrinibacteria bacterium]
MSESLVAATNPEGETMGDEMAFFSSCFTGLAWRISMLGKHSPEQIKELVNILMGHIYDFSCDNFTTNPNPLGRIDFIEYVLGDSLEGVPAEKYFAKCFSCLTEDGEVASHQPDLFKFIAAFFRAAQSFHTFSQKVGNRPRPFPPYSRLGALTSGALGARNVTSSRTIVPALAFDLASGTLVPPPGEDGASEEAAATNIRDLINDPEPGSVSAGCPPSVSPPPLVMPRASFSVAQNVAASEFVAVSKPVEREVSPLPLRQQSLRLPIALTHALLVACCFLNGGTRATPFKEGDAQKELAFARHPATDESEGLVSISKVQVLSVVEVDSIPTASTGPLEVHRFLDRHTNADAALVFQCNPGLTESSILARSGEVDVQLEEQRLVVKLGEWSVARSYPLPDCNSLSLSTPYIVPLFREDPALN